MAKEERYRSITDVYLVLRRPEDGWILMMTRANTGFQDGKAGLPSGHLDRGESIPDAVMRETKEEVGVVIQPGDLEFAHASNWKFPGEDEGRTGVFFVAERWSGEPYNAEPAKCSGVFWADPANLPDNTIAFIADCLAHVANGVPFSTWGWQ